MPYPKPQNTLYKKSGYLESDFKLFHLKDSFRQTFDFHYHDFHKILIFLSGNASYIIEGRQYDLHPCDMLLIRAGDIHKPVIRKGAAYERIILYLSPRFFTENSSAHTDLFHCFESVKERQSCLIRLRTSEHTPLLTLIKELPAALRNQEFGADLYQKAKLLEYLILLNRTVQTRQADYSPPATAHPVILSVMEYINNHITEDLSIDTIAGSMFLNRSYLMHLFKSETGCTIGKYITEKRLFLTGQYRNQGYSVTEACYKSGFKNYASFYHASRKKQQTSRKIKTAD